MRLPLILHPESRCDAVSAITVDVAREGGALSLRYTLTGDMSAVALAPALPAPTRGDELWTHTCLEAFLRLRDGEGYHECNFAPSRQWALYWFDAYRKGMSIAYEFAPPTLDVARRRDAFELSAGLDLSNFAAEPTWRLGLSAVIEETSGQKSYWALRHATGKPDFHHVASFAYEITT